MKDKELITRDIFAFFGKAMYLAQIVEKGMMNIVLIDKLKNSITKSRLDELSSELTKLTFGQLKRQIKETQQFTESELKKIDSFQDKRDFLTHSYWWERGVELSIEESHLNIIKELNEIGDSFENINNLIKEKTDVFIKENDIDIKRISTKLKSTGKTAPLKQYQTLKKSETIENIFSYKNTSNSIIPIFKLTDNTYWTVCEIGLSQYKEDIIEENKIEIPVLNGIFPIKQFNPRPKIVNLWNYELDLKKNGLKMIINKNDNQFMEWGIKKR